MYVFLGTARLARSSISNCIATESGGGLYSAGGSTSLSDGTLISSCLAREGRSVFLLAGEVSYAFPAPAGRWLPNGRCEVYREACAYQQDSNEQKDCLAHRDDCALTESDAMEPSSGEKEAACRRHSAPDKEACLERVAELWYCQPATNVQPCNWEEQYAADTVAHKARCEEMIVDDALCGDDGALLNLSQQTLIEDLLEKLLLSRLQKGTGSSSQVSLQKLVYLIYDSSPRLVLHSRLRSPPSSCLFPTLKTWETWGTLK